MGWWWLLAAVVLLAFLAWRMILAFNTLSLNHSLCLAAWHQLDRTLAMRHTLVGALLDACPPGSDTSGALVALRAAENLGRARATAAERHPVEMALLEATGHLGGLEDLDEDQRMVLEQLTTINGWVASSARYYNRNVDRYLRRRSRPSALLFRRRFPPMSRFTWPSDGPGILEESDGQATADLDLPIREADNPEGYRPVSFTNILRRQAPPRAEGSRPGDSLEA